MRPFSRDGGRSLLSTERSLSLPLGTHIRPGTVHGYYIDLRSKAESPAWPPEWLAPRQRRLHVSSLQWALGCHERYLAGDGEAWLQAAIACGRYLVEEQERDGPRRGGWVHLHEMPHTYRLRPPWLSAMAQGEAASLLVRLHLASGEDAFAGAALRALEPMARMAERGGVRSTLSGLPFLEEYPTRPPSHVLNGAIFALWGYHDVAVGLGDEGAGADFEECVGALAANLHLYDTGFWSRYDLFPHPVVNVSSAAYHSLHINQLKAMQAIAPNPAFRKTLERFESYRSSAACRARAMTRKVLFRLLVPRNPLLANRLPWAHR